MALTKNLMSQIPKDFYRLFGSKYMEYYMTFLVAICEESSRSGSTLGLTEQECRTIINEKLTETTIDWSEERFDEEGSLLTRSNMAAVCLNYFEEWGWLRKDYDETLNSYVVSFPEYSQLYVELFQKLYKEEDSSERESVLAVYSYLFTYSSDAEKNNEILESALQTSRRLSRMLGNMREGMRGYFDELSRQRDFRGIQEVLVKEINNSDSKKYAILTTTDSFYRYKEAVKELISEILNENDEKKAVLLKEKNSLETGTLLQKRNEYRLQYCEDTSRIVMQLEREFDMIERKYNKLIEQKTVFAKRALARIHYILQEGVSEEDNIIKLINLLDRSEKKDEILVEMRERIRFSSQFKNITDNSFAGRRDRGDGAFAPVMLDEEIDAREQHMTDFVPKPLYTRNELQSFRRKNTVDGVFVATEETVQSVEDLEKLLFLWQEETEERLAEDTVSVDGEIRSEDGLTYSRLVIGQNK